MTDTDRVLRFLNDAAKLASGEADGLEPPSEAETLAEARRNMEAALPHAHAGGEIPADARLSGLKKAMATGFRPVTSHQRIFNIHSLAAIENLSRAVEALSSHLAYQDTQIKRLQAGSATTNLTVDDLLARVEDQAADVEAARRIMAVEERLDRISGRLAEIGARQNLIFRQARAALDDELRPEQLRELSRELDLEHEELRADLQDVFRGSREHITELLGAYLPDVEAAPGSGPVIDIGCGRGEWLEVLRDAGIDSYGVDSDQLTVDRCTERGLDVRHDDALAHLRSLPESSVRAITCFHIVEHLSLDTLVGLIDAALLALRPGGLLIMETPNPSNLVVGAFDFYLDPTHLRPVHPEFLRFLVLQRGFLEAELRFLHPMDVDRLNSEDLAGSGRDPVRAERLVDRLNTLLAGPADYAVLTHKAPAGS